METAIRDGVTKLLTSYRAMNSIWLITHFYTQQVPAHPGVVKRFHVLAIKMNCGATKECQGEIVVNTTRNEEELRQ